MPGAVAARSIAPRARFAAATKSCRRIMSNTGDYKSCRPYDPELLRVTSLKLALPVATIAIALFVSRKRGISWREGIGLRPPRLGRSGSMARRVGVSGWLSASSASITWVSNRPKPWPSLPLGHCLGPYSGHRSPWSGGRRDRSARSHPGPSETNRCRYAHGDPRRRSGLGRDAFLVWRGDTRAYHARRRLAWLGSMQNELGVGADLHAHLRQPTVDMAIVNITVFKSRAMLPSRANGNALRGLRLPRLTRYCRQTCARFAASGWCTASPLGRRRNATPTTITHRRPT